MTATITLTDFDALDIAEALRNAASYRCTTLDNRDRQALALLATVPGLPDSARALAAELADGTATLPLPDAQAMHLMDVIGRDDLLGPEPEWDVQEAWLAARKPAEPGEALDEQPAVMAAAIVPAGELARVLELLEGDGHLLHPDGDLFGTTRQDMGDGVVRFSGNFWELSYAFHVETGDPELIARLERAIDKQRGREAYVQAVAENRAYYASWGHIPA